MRLLPTIALGLISALFIAPLAMAATTKKTSRRAKTKRSTSKKGEKAKPRATAAAEKKATPAALPALSPEQEEKYNNSDVQMYQQLIKTYSETIKTKDLVGNAIKNVNTIKTTGQVLGNITVTPIANTQILQIKYKDDNGKEAKEILSAITNEFINTSKTLVANGNVKVIESVEEPKSPVTPKKFLNISMGIAIGLLTGLGISILLETMDRTFKDREEIEKLVGIPVIGVIPSQEFTKRRR